MKFAFTAVAVGATLACACHAASAQNITSDITVTQQGSGNTAYTEQAGIPSDSRANAVITQIGNDNHVGGPGATGGGLLQLNNPGFVEALIGQEGRGNNVDVLQAGTGNPHPIRTEITQRGSGNGVKLEQHANADMFALIEQNGSGNRANVDQRTNMASFVGRQDGNGNHYTLSLSGQYSGANLAQNGDGNAVSIVLDNVQGGIPGIVQNGTLHTAAIQQRDADFSLLAIDQQGSGNHADTSQTGDNHVADIRQNGSGNAVELAQIGPRLVYPADQAVIIQLGNANKAIVRQVGQNYVANVNQAGSGNFTKIYQH